MAWGQILVAVAALTSIRIFTELLGPTNYGAAMLVQGGVTLFDSIGVMALSQTLIARCGPVVDIERRREVSLALSKSFFRWMGPIGTVISFVASFIAVVQTADWAWFVVAPLICVYIAAGTIRSSILSLVILDRRYGVQSAWAAVEALLSILGISASLILWRPDALGYLAGYTVSVIFSTLLFMLIVAPSHLREVRQVSAEGELRPALSYGVPVALMGPLGWVSTYLDRYILGWTLGTAGTGVYVAVTGLVARPYSLTSTVLTNYFRPLYFRSPTNDMNSDHHARILRSWVISAFAVGGLGTVAFAVLGHPVSQLALAPEFRDGATTLMILFAVSQTFTIVTHAADNAILAMRESRKLLQAQLVISVLTLVFIPIGIALAGLLGAVIGRCFAEAVKLGIVMTLSLRVARRNRLVAPIRRAYAEDGFE